MKDLLKSYQNAYDFKLRLTVNGQSVFCDFDGPSGSELSFVIREDHLMLECNQERQEILKGISIALSHVYHKEDSFLKLILNEASSSDINRFTSGLSGTSYVLVLIQCQDNSQDVMQMMHHLSEKNVPMTTIKDQVIVLMEHQKNLKQHLISIKDTLESELYCRIKMVISSRINQIELISEFYEEIQSVYQLMNHYDPSVDVMETKECWLMSMVDCMSVSRKESLMMYLVDHEELDDELLSTALCFFENNLSISTTARALYVHRNTLIYRLDKIMQITGLDLRVFDDAMKLKVWMTLKKK